MYSPYAKVINPRQPRSSRYVYRGRAGKQRRTNYYNRNRRMPTNTRTSGFYGRFTGPAAEKKFIDFQSTRLSIAAPANKLNIVRIPTGTGPSERIGRKVQITNIRVRGIMQLNSQDGMTKTSEIVKITILQDTQTNGATFDTTQWLDTDTVISFNNLENSQRFRTLKVKYFNLHSPTAIVETNTAEGTTTLHQQITGEMQKHYTMNLRVNIPIEYGPGEDGDVDEQRTNSIYFITQTASGELVTSAVEIRVRYTDN